MMSRPPPSDAFTAAILLLAARSPERAVAEAAERAGLGVAVFEQHFERRFGIALGAFLDLLPLADARALLERSRPRLAAALEPVQERPLPLAITGMAPRRSYSGMVLRWGRHPSPFGGILAAATEQGVCRLGFDGDDPAALARLAADWPGARLDEDPAMARTAVARAFAGPRSDQAAPLPVVLAGTAFQQAVWQALVAIPFGGVVSYQDIAAAVGKPRAVRAVGGAVGANPVAVLVPCHRVILASGALHNFGWGPPLKRALLAWERGHAAASGP